MRKYKQTHPWLRFELDMRPFPWTLWLLLGEAQSKCEHIAGVPLRPDVAAKLHRVYLAKGVHATTAIEGNTLSEGDVLAHMDGTLKVPPSKQYLEKEISNVLAALDSIFDDGLGGSDMLQPERIKAYNARVLDGVPHGDGVVPGESRTHGVGVGHYLAPPAEDCEHLLARLCEWLNGQSFCPGAHANMAFAIVKAVLAHLYLAWIHGFGDGNGRTARLVEFQILVGAGVPSPAAHLLSNHYNETRAEYYRQLQQASASGGDVVPFIQYAVQGLVDGLKAQVAEIRLLQMEVAWRNLVHEQFRDTSAVSQRRRHLVLDLSGKGLIPEDEVAHVSPRVAEGYAGLTKKTLTRDLQMLEREHLVVRDGGMVSANTALISAFLPERRSHH